MKVIESKVEEYNKEREINNDPYGSAILRYADYWATLMEKEIDEGKSISDVAKSLSREADTEGITGFMYGSAVGHLSYFWQHGEELRRWHNLDCQIGKEGEKANESGGVLNPAILSVG